MVQVHYDEGVANHIGPEPCAVVRKGGSEASAGERIGQPLSHEKSKPREADEQSGAIRSGAGGAKDRDQGECEPAKHVPGTGPGKRVTGAGAHTTSSKAKEEGEVHSAAPPHQH